MRIYETTYICPPNLDEDTLEDFNDLVREIIYDNGGKIIKQENWGKRRLAYTISHHNEGIYYYFLYGGNGATVAELERRFRISEQCIRFLTVRLDNELKGKKHKIFTEEELRLALQMEPEARPSKKKRKAGEKAEAEAAPEEPVAEKTAESEEEATEATAVAAAETATESATEDDKAEAEKVEEAAPEKAAEEKAPEPEAAENADENKVEAAEAAVKEDGEEPAAEEKAAAEVDTTAEEKQD